LFVAGQGPFDSKGNMIGTTIADQTRATLENVKAIVEAGGATMADVVRVNVYLTDLAHFAAMNEVYASFFAEPYPARTTVQVGLLGFLVEIDAVAELTTSLAGAAASRRGTPEGVEHPEGWDFPGSR
jgi:2-iminobutanoate/2-iminopropanoate deaminase